jgi:hypothetical protein
VQENQIPKLSEQMRSEVSVTEANLLSSSKITGTWGLGVCWNRNVSGTGCFLVRHWMLKKHMVLGRKLVTFGGRERGGLNQGLCAYY